MYHLPFVAGVAADSAVVPEGLDQPFDKFRPRVVVVLVQVVLVGWRESVQFRVYGKQKRNRVIGPRADKARYGGRESFEVEKANGRRCLGEFLPEVAANHLRVLSPTA